MTEKLCPECGEVRYHLEGCPELYNIKIATCITCSGAGIISLSPDPDVIGAATCPRCGGSGVFAPELETDKEK